MTFSADRDADFLALQRALAGRYSVERELGRGAMATVYLARDLERDRLIALFASLRSDPRFQAIVQADALSLDLRQYYGRKAAVIRQRSAL